MLENLKSFNITLFDAFKINLRKVLNLLKNNHLRMPYLSECQPLYYFINDAQLKSREAFLR